MFSLDIEMKSGVGEERSVGVLMLKRNVLFCPSITVLAHRLSHCRCLWTSLCFETPLSSPDGLLCLSSFSCLLFATVFPVPISVSVAVFWQSFLFSQVTARWLQSWCKLSWVLSSQTLNQYRFCSLILTLIRYWTDNRNWHKINSTIF